MNERIKELMGQTLDEKFAGTWSVMDLQDLTKFTDRFAESIVRECMEMCANVSADYLKHRKAAYDFQDKNIYAEGEAACDILKYKMKKHFGMNDE
jgi:hypothetical protein